MDTKTSPASKHTGCDHGPGHSCEQCAGPEHDMKPLPPVMAFNEIIAICNDTVGEDAIRVDFEEALVEIWAFASRGRKTPAANNHERLVSALRELLEYAPGGTDDAICHKGITTRDKCSTCKRRDEAEAALAAAQEGE